MHATHAASAVASRFGCAAEGVCCSFPDKSSRRIRIVVRSIVCDHVAAARVMKSRGPAAHVGACRMCKTQGKSIKNR